MAELRDRQREVVVFRYVEDLPLAYIAEMLAVGEGTVKRSPFPARRTLARSLGAEEVTDGDDR